MDFNVLFRFHTINLGSTFLTRDLFSINNREFQYPRIYHEKSSRLAHSKAKKPVNNQGVDSACPPLAPFLSRG
jgi:hypothetical protein